MNSKTIKIETSQKLKKKPSVRSHPVVKIKNEQKVEMGDTIRQIVKDRIQKGTQILNLSFRRLGKKQNDKNYISEN